MDKHIDREGSAMSARKRPTAKNYVDYLKLASAMQQAANSSYIYDMDGLDGVDAGGIGMLLLTRD